MKKRKIYTEQDWQAADGTDRLYMHLMEPDRWALMPQEEEKLDALRRTWAIVCNKSSTFERITLIRTGLGVCERTAFRYIRDANKLFGETLDVDPELEMKLNYGRFMRLHDAAKRADDFDNARRALESASKVLEKIVQSRPLKKPVYASVVFTDDPKALEMAEDIPFEEIDEKSLLEFEANRIPAGD